MNKFSNFLRKKARKWLQLEQAYALSDVNILGPSVVIVASQFREGDRVKIIKTRFRSLNEFERLINIIERSNGVDHLLRVDDIPRGTDQSPRHWR